MQAIVNDSAGGDAKVMLRGEGATPGQTDTHTHVLEPRLLWEMKESQSHQDALALLQGARAHSPLQRAGSVGPASQI